MRQNNSVEIAVGMGTNLGDRHANLISAARFLAVMPDSGKLVLSPIYHSEAVDCLEPHAFLNAVARLETRLEPLEVLDYLQEIENRFGRTRPYPNAPRPIDLDLLLYGSDVRTSERLTIPHPRMDQRLFVLQPLAAVWGEAWHPLQNRTIRELATEQAQHEPTGSVMKSSQHWPTDLFC